MTKRSSWRCRAACCKTSNRSGPWKCVTRAAARPNASGEIYARLGLIYSQLGKADQAAAANRTAIKKSPGLARRLPEPLPGLPARTSSRRRRSRCWMRPPGSRIRTPTFSSAWRNSTLSFGVQVPAQKDSANAKALALLNRAEKLSPLTPLLRLKLADGFNLLGDSAKAAQLYLEVLKQPPDLPLIEERVRANLTAIYLRGSDHKRAVEQLQAILRDDPDQPPGLLLPGPPGAGGQETGRGRRPFQQGDPAEPGFRVRILLPGAWRKSSWTRPARPWPRSTRRGRSSRRASIWNSIPALAFSRQKAYTEALQHFVAAEVIAKATDPKLLDEGFYFQVGATCERKGDYAQAEKYFEKCLKLAPDSAEAMNYLGYMWAEHGQKLDQARELIEKAVKAEPKNAAYLDSLAWVLFKLKQPKEALPYALKAAELSEKPDATVYDHIGRHLRRAEATGEGARGLAQVALA